MDCFRAGLDNKELAAFSVFCPLDIHRHPFTVFFRVVLLDFYTPVGELANFFICYYKIASLFVSCINNLCLFYALVASVDHFLEFCTQVFRDYSVWRFLKRLFRYKEFIGSNFSLHHHFTQAPRTIYDNDIFKAGFSIEGKHYA